MSNEFESVFQAMADRSAKRAKPAEAPEPHTYTERVRQFFLAHPAEWTTTLEVAAAVRLRFRQAGSALGCLEKSGVIESRRIPGKKHKLYRLVQP
jgi:hypothetical protein